MPYNSLIDRTGVEALIPEDVSREIIQGVPEASFIMRMARRLPSMTRDQQRLPVLSSLITAYFVAGDTGLKQTSRAQWANKYINAAELAVIVPIPEAVLADVDYDIWSEIRPRIVEAIGVAFDQAVMYGTNAPADWPTALVPGAVGAGNAVTIGTVGTDLYDDIMSENGVLSKVELDGFDVTGHLAAMRMKSKLRGLRDLQGQPLFVRTMQTRTPYELDGSPLDFPKNGAIDDTQSLMVSGDWTQLVYAIRQDITYKLLTEAVIQDNTGAIIYNLPQQDMVALRTVIRLGWQLPNPINRMQQVEADRYPFGVLLPAGS